MTAAGTKARAAEGARILVVDDSAVVRQALTQILAGAGMQVEVAADPIIAIERIRRRRPDAIVLDIEMPRMDGLTFLRWLMAQEEPVPALICSSLVGPGTDVALQALERGAVGIVAKPALGVKGFLHDSAAQLVEAVRGAAQARVRCRAAPPEPRRDAGAVLPPRRTAPLASTTSKVVAIGASTGGTEALRSLLKEMPPDAPGIAIVQHMPEVFTAAFARHLHEMCRIEVKEAATGDRICSVRALVAPGNHHLAVRRSGAHYVAEVLDGPPVSRHRPSVDVLFRSAAQAAGPNAVGVILTGMGDDGARGLLEMREAGAHTVAQDEASCVVFGMPKEAIAAGAACEVLPLQRIAAAVLVRAR
jgi:two-component system chemotaxis response regulator CheB